MKGNGQLQGRAESGAATSGEDNHVLRWPGRVVSADDLRRNLNGQRELIVSARTVITPLAAEHLRANGISITRQDDRQRDVNLGPGLWGYALEGPEPLVASVLQALAREGLQMKPLQPGAGEAASWARAVAECVARSECQGGVVFCRDAGLACCVANKVKGLRAAAAVNGLQAARAFGTLGANFLAVEMPGPTFFEIRQMLRCLARPATCSANVAGVLQELDGHAHR